MQHLSTTKIHEVTPSQGGKVPSSGTSACGRSAGKAKINKFADVSPALIIVTQRERKFHVTDRQARECRRNEGRRRKVEELLQAGWPSPQILIFWFTGSCPSFLGSCPPHHPASFIPHTFLSLFLYFIANNTPY